MSNEGIVNEVSINKSRNKREDSSNYNTSTSKMTQQLLYSPTVQYRWRFAIAATVHCTKY